MRILLQKAWGAAVAGLAGLAVSAAIVSHATDASAADRPNVRRGVPSADVQAKTYNPEHVSTIRIGQGEMLPQSRGIKVGRNKAALIELPRDLRDVVVSDPGILDAVVQSSNRVHLIGKKAGQSNVFFFDLNGEQVLTLEVSVEQDTAALDSLFRRLIAGSNIKSEVLNETVILTGSVRNPVDATRAADIASRFIVGPNTETHIRHPLKVINMLSVEGEEQVMLKVVVAEVQRSLLKQFGVNLAADINAGSFVAHLMTANALPLTAAAGLGSMPIPGFNPTIDPKNMCSGVTCMYADGPTKETFGNSGVTSHYSSGHQSVSKAVRALERDGLIKTLAEPNLTAVSGETANFLAGGEYPIPVIDSQGQMTIIYKEFGVGLAFTPMVMSEGRISLKIETMVSELTNAGAVQLNNSVAIPALKTRKAKSTVELPSGGSVALAGLISEDTRQNIDGFPGLKDLPVLGTLFRSRDFVKQETELVVIVTPYLVKSTARQELARPLDGLGDATDMKANFLGHINRIYGKGNAPPVGDLKGDYGFIVD